MRPNFEISPESTALLIIDMQNFCANPDYGLCRVLKEKFADMYDYYCKRLQQIIPNNIKLLNFLRFKE